MLIIILRPRPRRPADKVSARCASPGPFPVPAHYRQPGRPSPRRGAAHNVVPQPHALRLGEKGPPFCRRRPPRPRRRPKAVASMMSRTHCASTKNNRPASNVRRSAHARKPTGSYLGRTVRQKMRARNPGRGGAVPAEPPRAEEHVHGALGGFHWGVHRAGQRFSAARCGRVYSPTY